MTGKEGDSACVIVLHEVWGPDQNITTACRRLGRLEFATMVPDLYEGYGRLLTAPNIRSAMEVVWGLSLEERRDKRKVNAEAARREADATDREVLSVMYDQRFRERLVEITLEAISDARTKHGSVATLGFSLGGGLSLASATKPGCPDSAVAYCAEPPALRGLAGVKTPMLAICASEDDLMSPLMPAFVKAAKNSGVDLTVQTFQHTKHDFFNHTMKDRYDRAAAEVAWDVATSFLTRTLRRRSLSKR